MDEQTKKLQTWIDSLPVAQRIAFDILIQGSWFDELTVIMGEVALVEKGDEFLREMGYCVEQKNAELTTERLAREKAEATVERLWAVVRGAIGSNPDHCSVCKAVHDRDIDFLDEALGVES